MWNFLRNKSGQPITTQLSMQFQIFDADKGGAPVWDSGLIIVTVNEGIYIVGLGTESNPIDYTVIKP